MSTHCRLLSLLATAIAIACFIYAAITREPGTYNSATTRDTEMADALNRIEMARLDVRVAQIEAETYARLEEHANNIDAIVHDATVTGYLQSRYLLSELYLEGIGIEQDLTLAMMWNLLSYPDPLDDDVVNRLFWGLDGENEVLLEMRTERIIGAGLTNEQIDRAGELAALCVATDFADCPLP